MTRDNDMWSANAADSQTSVASQQPIDVLTPASDELGSQLALKNLEKRRAAKKRKRLVKLLVSCAVAGGLIAVVVGHSLRSNAETVDDYVPETAIVERRDFENTITASGALKAGSSEVVTPEVDGIIESVSVSEGQKVSKGDVLFTIKNEQLDKAVRDAGQDVEAAERAVGQAQSAVTQAQATRDDAWDRYNDAWAVADAAHRAWATQKREYTKLHDAWQKAYDAAQKLPGAKLAEPKAPEEPKMPDTKGMESAEATAALNEYNRQYADYQAAFAIYLQDSQDYRDYQNALAAAGEEPQPAGEEPTYPEKPDDISLAAAIEDAQEGVTTANQALTKAREAYDEAVEQAEKRVVKAPSDGSVVTVGASVGASTTTEAGGEPLVRISNMNQMAVDIEVNEIDILSIKKGQTAKVTFSAVKDVEVDAIVSEVASVSTGEGGEGGGIVTFRVGLTIPKPDKQLRAGMTATVKIVTADVKDALVVPSSAISEGSSAATVDVVMDEETMEAETREVTLGARGASEVVIESGLSEGEMVLLNGGMGDYDEEFMG